MKKLLLFSLSLSLLFSCNPADVKEQKSDDDEPVVQDFFAKGADISWITEMEKKGYRFYDDSGKETECTALLAASGFNAVRYRVWVNPDGGWCGAQDVLTKAVRAKALGLKIMIDFHYSDWWADPGKQNVPAAWKGYDVQKMAEAVGKHTSDVLSYLRQNGIDVSWVQVGNEVENGMLWESGKVEGNSAANFASYFNAGRNAVKSVYPDAKVILHVSNAWNTEVLNWFFGLMRDNSVYYDMIGLSLYPSYWENGAYPDWKTKTGQAVKNFSFLHANFSKDVMLVEFGMPVSQPDKAKECLQYLMDNTEGCDWFKGIFLWEPESEPERNGYDYGAFKGGKPTIALDPFKNK